jgi:hypothetical protein
MISYIANISGTIIGAIGLNVSIYDGATLLEKTFTDINGKVQTYVKKDDFAV